MSPTIPTPEASNPPTPLEAKVALRGLTSTQLEEFCETQLGEPRFRGRQLFQWLHARQARDYAKMTNLSKRLREKLPDVAILSAIEPHQTFDAPDGTTKMTFKLYDDAVIEAVVIPAKNRATLCVSSQVGCAIGCRFCLTAKMGLVRHLQPAEIVEQVGWAKTLWEEKTGQRISNIVFMGMGEPLHNYDTVTQALRILLDPQGMNFSRRKITVSTSGLVPSIERLGAEADIRVNLAISLNATTDEVRDEIMPINKKWNIDALLGALKRYPLEPRQRITFEYVLLGGLNDTPDDARRLIKLLRGIPHKINLIPWNPHPGAAYKRPSREDTDRFQRFLLDHNISTTVRETRGLEAMAACGQLGQPGKAAAWRDRVREDKRAARLTASST